MAQDDRGDAAECASATTTPNAATSSQEFEPRTPLDHELWALRREIIASAPPLATAPEIEAELAEQRREPGDSEAWPAATSTWAGE